MINMQETEEQLKQRIKALEEQKRLLGLKDKANKLEQEIAYKEDEVNPSLIKRLWKRL